MTTLRKFLYINTNIDEAKDGINDFTKEEYKKFKKRIAVDFDGVIHSFHAGWQDGKIYGYVIEGAVEALTQLKNEGYEIVIHTARICNPDGTLAPARHKDLKIWLDENEIPYHSIEPKIPAIIYIDDRAINCNPLKEKEKSWDRTLERIKKMNEVH